MQAHWEAAFLRQATDVLETKKRIEVEQYTNLIHLFLTTLDAFCFKTYLGDCAD